MKKYTVEKEVLRMLPEMEKPKFDSVALDYLIDLNEWDELLKKQPTIKRGDNGQWSIGDVKIENEDFDVKYESPDGGFVFDYSDAKEHQQFELFTPIALPKKKQQESEETFTFSEDELYSIISRSQIHALKEDWLTPAEVLKKIKAEYRKGRLNNTIQ